MDVFVPQPEVPADAAEALPVLLPVPVERDEATLSSLNDGPATACRLHVTEHLQLRAAQKVIRRKLIHARDAVVLLVEGRAVIAGICKRDRPQR